MCVGKNKERLRDLSRREKLKSYTMEQLNHCLTLGTLLNLSLSQFPHLENGNNNKIYFIRTSDIIHVKHLGQCLHITRPQ